MTTVFYMGLGIEPFVNPNDGPKGVTSERHKNGGLWQETGGWTGRTRDTLEGTKAGRGPGLENDGKTLVCFSHMFPRKRQWVLDSGNIRTSEELHQSIQENLLQWKSMLNRLSRKTRHPIKNGERRQTDTSPKRTPGPHTGIGERAHHPCLKGEADQDSDKRSLPPPPETYKGHRNCQLWPWRILRGAW